MHTKVRNQSARRGRSTWCAEREEHSMRNQSIVPLDIGSALHTEGSSGYIVYREAPSMELKKTFRYSSRIFDSFFSAFSLRETPSIMRVSMPFQDALFTRTVNICFIQTQFHRVF